MKNLFVDYTLQELTKRILVAKQRREEGYQYDDLEDYLQRTGGVIVTFNRESL